MNPKLLINIAAKFTSTLTPGIQGLTQSVKPCHQKKLRAKFPIRHKADHVAKGL
jgi:hypothetical protein